MDRSPSARPARTVARVRPAGGGPACADDRTFFCEEIERLTPRLYGAALHFTRNRVCAEDLVSETVVKAWAHLAQLDDRECFEKWIFRILANTFYSDCRRICEQPIDVAADDEDDEREPFSLFDRLHQPFLLWWGNPEQELVNKLLCEDLDRALATLPPCFRAVVVSVDLLGHSYDEVAQMLGVPVGTVRSRLNRARSRLQRALWRQGVAAGLVPRAAPRGGPDD